MPATAAVTAAAPPWLRDLSAVLHGELDADTRRRAEYSSDASNYRLVPLAVVFPRDEHDVVACVEAARAHGVGVTARGAGTSIAGNAVGEGLVLDFSRHLTAIVEIDPEARTATVQPGVILRDLNTAARVHGLRFGPDPSTASRCTLGGMIGNNACGPRAMTWGTTADNVRALRFVDGTGRITTAGQGFDGHPGLEAFTSERLGLLRLEFGRFGRQVSGYALQHLLPENGRDLAKALAGTEGTCGILLEATVSLVAIPDATCLVVLGYENVIAAADDVPALLRARPLAIESMDAALVGAVRQADRARSVPELPRGGAWLFVETSGHDPAAAEGAANALAAPGATAAVEARVVTDPVDASRLWSIREDGVGLAGRTRDGRPAWPGWEDAAVPPEALGAYLRDFDALTSRHGVDGLAYGHFGDGCVHTRLDFPFESGSALFRSFVEDAADLVICHGGSLSGEHGDGRARGELLEKMYSAEAIRSFAEFKRLFDPAGILNPGVGVDPAPLDDALRVPSAHRLPVRGIGLPHDRGDFAEAVHRCTGIGRCRAETAGSFLCPSFLATGDEKDSTRGRARVLQEMANGSLVTGGFAAPEVEESLDLCLSCRACSSDCPAGVDVAAYKSEVLYRRYAGKVRPLAHYTFGRLPRWLRLASLPGVAGLLAVSTRLRPLTALGLRLIGADPRRAAPGLPLPAAQTFRAWWRGRVAPPHGGRRVVLWTDSFTNALTPEVGIAAVRVLEDAGFEVVTVARQECCGLTWITTGQLDQAKRLLTSALDALEPFLAEGIPIVGLEPSCTAVLRSDVVDLLPDDPRARAVAEATRTLAELLSDPALDWAPPSLAGEEIVVQPHCHQHAVMGFDADEALLLAAGARLDTVSGCCGLAGNFGMEKGHYDVSVAVAENGLLPALRRAGDEATLLADGFSCRTQAAQLGGAHGLHLAELLAARLPKGR